MLKRFFQSIEDPQRPLLGPNIWILSKIELLLPDNYVGKVAYIIVHEIVTYFVITQFIELYIIRSDLDLALTNMKISMLSSVCVIKANTFVLWQSKWRSIISYITDADKFERDTRDITRGRILDTYTTYCRKVTYGYWFLVTLTFFTTTSMPLIHISQRNFREAFKNETVEFPHIFSSWMPFDKNHNPGMIVTVVWHILLCAYGASVMASYDTAVIVIMVFFGGKLDLLSERCKQMLGDGVGVSDEQAVQTTKELHTIHVLLTKYYRLFNSVLSPVMFQYVVMCALMLCASAYQLTSASTNATQKILLLEYLVFGIVQLFMFCWHSNDVLVKSGKVAFGPYESQWWSAGLRQRRLVLLLAGQLRLEHLFTAGPFTNLTLPTFIIKGAYSYYTLLRK